MSEPLATPGSGAPRKSVRPVGGRRVTRQVFMALVTDEVARAWRYDRMLSVALARIDPMDRPAAEQNGLKAADVELTALDFLAADLRAPDKIALLASGEFGILLPEATPHHARIAAQRLCDKVASASFRARGTDFTVTLSIGAASLNHSIRTAEQLLLTARHERRMAKSRGGNCISGAQPFRLRTGNVRSGEIH